MEKCIFCKIVAGDLPSTKIYEDDHTIAFLDIMPVNKGHTLVIPKEHHVNILDTPEDVLKQVISTVKKVASALSKYADGINIGQSNKPAAGQDVDHLHFHLMPRFANDGYELWKGQPYLKGEAAKVAEAIKKLL